MTLKELLEQAKSQGIDLTEVDTRNKRRVIRAIEAKGQKPTRSELRPDTVIIGLKPAPDELRQQVDKRVEHMLTGGLEQEVKNLARRYGWDNEPMKGIGYRQWKDYFEGTQSLDETERKINKATMDLAKRQQTWLKRNLHIKWFENAQSAYQYLNKNVDF